MLVTKKKTPLPAAPREVKVRYDRHVSYRQLYQLILDGKLRAEQVNGRYSVEIDEVAEALGLTERAT
jgi:hypothetical protein